MGNYARKIITKSFSPLISKIGLQHLTKSIYSGRGHILMFHRVIPETSATRIHNHLSLEISPELLNQIIQYFRIRKYEFINLDSLGDWLNINEHNYKKFVIFTFDDGYKDNVDYAYPILKKNQIPFTIYITTSFPDNKAIIWWYLLEKVILENSKIDFPIHNVTSKISCETIYKKEIAFSIIRDSISHIEESTLESQLNAFFYRYGYSLYSANDYALSWHEIRELSDDPLVTIGSHTVNHYNLKGISDDNSFYEISESKKIITQKIHKNVNHFSYPLGLYGPREIENVKSCGYLTSTTTKTANIFYQHIQYPFSLPRIPINCLTTQTVLDLQIKGFFPSILNKFKRIIK